MEQLPRLAARIASLHELRDLMRALRALAAARVQEAQAALTGIRRHVSVVEDSIAAGLELFSSADRVGLPPGPDGPGVVIAICSEHGFVGAYNERVLDRAAQQMAGGGQLVIVGHRGATLAAERGLAVARRFPMPTHTGGVLALTRRTADFLATAPEATIIYGAYRHAGLYEVAVRRVLPLDPSVFRAGAAPARPLHHLPPAALLQRLAGEYLFAELTATVMESLASENGARLAVMEAADRNIAEKLEALIRRAHGLRQNAITEELLDVATGAQAILGAGR